LLHFLTFYFARLRRVVSSRSRDGLEICHPCVSFSRKSLEDLVLDFTVSFTSMALWQDLMFQYEFQQLSVK